MLTHGDPGLTAPDDQRVRGLYAHARSLSLWALGFLDSLGEHPKPLNQELMKL
jgi:hypothetical protein